MQRSAARLASFLVPLAIAALWTGGCAGGGAASPEAGASGARTPAAGSYAFWPQFPDEPRVQFLRSISSSEDVSPSSESGLERIVFGNQAGNSESVNKPYGAAMRDGRIYVCDIRNGSVTVLDLGKRQTRLVGVTGSMPLKRPVAVALADDGEIYVADNDRGAIVVFDAQERYSRVMGHPKLKPAGLAVRADRLYVTDTASQLVEIYDRRTGSQLGSIGTIGDEDGQFRLPLGIAIDPKGDVYVADMMRCRIQKFSPDGKFISGFGTVGDYAGAFVRPKHIAIDSEGIIYVVDAAFQNVQMFDSQHRLLMHFGSSGIFPGSMNLPAGICVSDDSPEALQALIHPGFKAKRIVVVTNQFGDAKVSLYAMGGLREGFSARDLASAAATIPSGVGEGSKNLLPAPLPGGLIEEPPAPGAPPAGPAGSTLPPPAPPATPKPQ